MISAFRRSLDSWIVRVFFMLMVVAFVIWGVGDVLRQIFAAPTWVAKVAGQTIQIPDFQQEFQHDLNIASRNLPQGQVPSAKLRSRVGEVTLQRMITEAALGQELRRLHIVTPDAAVRAAVLAIPAFHGSDGKFSPQRLQEVLANNGLSENRFLEMMRGDIAQRQLLQAVAAGAISPHTETAELFAAEYEKRSAEMVKFPISAEPAPPPPTEAQLKRWYENHQSAYRAPEYRRIRAIVLSPQTLSGDIKITDAELHAAYNRDQTQYTTLAKRSAQVVSVPDEAKAKALAAQWTSHAGWTAMQAAAQKDGGSGVELNNATQRQFPDEALAKAVFAATPDTVTGPVKGALSWYVLKVTAATPGSVKTFDQVKAKLRERILAGKALDLMYSRANKLDDLLGNGTPLDKLPNNLGAVGVTGTLDAQGNDLQGNPAPIPGPPALRSALITAAFKARPGDLPQLVEVHTPSTGGSAYYALSVEKIIPAAEKPFDAVKQQVKSDWTDHQREREANVQATHMLVAVKKGQAFADAATVAGVKVTHTPLVTRSQTVQGMPPELQHVLFGLKKGEPAMVRTPNNFVVAVLAQVIKPDRKQDPSDYAQLQQALNNSIGSDLAGTFTAALRERVKPRVNRQNYDSVVQPQSSSN